MKDELGERMKGQYEHRTRFFVPRRTYSIIRLDGKAFHTYTRGLVKPFDVNLYKDMDEAIISMLPHIQGAVFAYTQSDEISVLVTDFALPTTSAWFDGNIQKMASVSSSIITAEFNKQRLKRVIADYMAARDYPDVYELDKLAYFDSRVFTIPDRTEVMNYFIWRNQDCSRNSVSMVAQSVFNHKTLQGKSTKDMIEMLKQHEEGKHDWETLDSNLKFGRMIVKKTYVSDPPTGYNSENEPIGLVERTKWVSTPSWRFTEDKEKLTNMIPQYL